MEGITHTPLTLCYTRVKLQIPPGSKCLTTWHFPPLIVFSIFQIGRKETLDIRNPLF